MLSKEATIFGGIALLVCCASSLTGAFILNARSPTHGIEVNVSKEPVSSPSVSKEPASSPGGSFKFYSGCDYDGEILQSINIGPVKTSDIDNFKGNIVTESLYTVPEKQQEQLLFKSVEVENMELKGSYIQVAFGSSEKKDINLSGTKKMSFCGPAIGGATKLNLTWKILKK